MHEDELDILELWGTVWRYKLIVVALFLLAGTLSAGYAISLKDVYRAEALVSPVVEGNTAQISGQLGIAASLAGVSVGQTDNRITNALAVLQSREFARSFIAKHNLLPWLFASNFDKSTGQSYIDPNIYDTNNNVWVGEEDSSKPSDWEAYKQLSAVMDVSEDNNGLIHIAIEWQDPVLAAQWANWLVSDINSHVKESDMREAQRAIDYLQEQLTTTQLVEMQRVFYQLIESQTRTLMLADVRDGYQFNVIDYAVAPEEANGPARLLLVAIGLMIGFLISIIIVFAYDQIEKRKKI